MTNGDQIRKMNDDELAEWLCKQIWGDYGIDPIMCNIHYHEIRNFLKMESEPKEEE